ncbi:MAG: type II toxin-antitoxin system VapC family toxin [Candidatus Lustribacter sp.]|jgi:PIN domain nuclease of toxin-antitoxin system
MKLLLDTHVVLSIVNERTADLPAALRGTLADPDAGFYVSVASLWEIAIKWRLGKLKLSSSLDLLPEIVTSGGLELIPINERHVLATVQPEPVTRDPFDRLLLAQCDVEDLRLLTVDRALISHRLAVRTDS